MKIPPRSTDYVDGRVALALGTMDRRLFRYGRTAPLTPMTTPARRSHHPRPGPQDQVTPADVRLMDQKGRASERSTKRIARPRAKPDDSIWRSIWNFVRRRVAVAINRRQRGRWIKRVGRGRRRLAVEDVLLTPTALDSLLELLVEFLVEFDRVRVDARPHDLDRFLEMDHGNLLRVFRLAERDHRGLAAQAFDIGAGIAVEVHRELLEVHAFEGHPLRVHL